MTDPVTEYQNDHDLLVKLNERVANLIDHVKTATTGTNSVTADHETRIRSAEEAITTMKSSQTMWRYILSTAVSIIGLAVGIIGTFQLFS